MESTLPPDALDPNRVKRALVIMLRHHGDVLLTSPIFTVLKSAIPHIEIDALVYKETAPMLTDHPAIHQIHLVDRSWKKQGVFSQLSQEKNLLSELGQRRYDLIIHLCGHWRGFWLTRLLKPRYAVAIKRPEKIWKKTFTHLYDDQINNRHRVERNLDALRRLGISPRTNQKSLVFAIGETAETEFSHLLNRHQLGKKNYLLIHPVSRWLFKCWPAEKFALLIDRLQQLHLEIDLTGSPDPAEMAFVQSICDKTPAPVVNLCGTLSLKALGAWISYAKLFIGVDSVPMHMASALKTPTVALFGPSNPLEWGPWENRHQLVVSEQFPCRPCLKDGCGSGKISDCLTQISVDDVFNAITNLLSIEKRD